MVRTLLLSEHDLDAWAMRFAVGEVPAPLPYGVDALEAAGFALRGVRQSSRPRVAKVREAVEHRTGLVLERPLRAVPLARRADLVLALLERQGMVPALLKSRRVPPYRRTPLVIWSCWLADDLRRAGSRERSRLRRRVEAADLVTCLSRHELPILAGLGLPEERLFAVDYGVSHEYYTPGPAAGRDIEILAVGQDRGRDYRTLVEAVRGTGLALDLVCPPESVAGVRLPENVRVHGPVPLSTYRTLLRRARVVAVPTHDLAYPTGSSVALEAASSGCALAITGTAAMADYFSDGADAALVAVGDVAGWRATLEELCADPGRRARLGGAARAAVVARHTADRMWAGLARVLVERGIVEPPAR